MRRVVYLVGLAIGMCMLSSCAAISRGDAPPDDMKSPDAALVYGYVEADNDNIVQVDFLQYNRLYVSPFKAPPRVLVFDDGVFMAENIKPGNYVIAGFRSERNNYNLSRSKRQSYQHIFRIKPGDMHYLGSYNLHVTQTGKIEYGDFKVTELERPGEREVLMRLYDATEGTAWQDKIARRLKELRQ
jgi:hypothetical protein